MWYAHSLPDTDKSRWQLLADHLKAVAALSSVRAEKFGAERAAAFAGLLHDLGKYTEKFQARLEGGASVDHSTAGAREVTALVTNADDRCIAEIIAHAIAGHHTGLPDSVGDGVSLDARVKRQLPELDPAWREEIAPIAHGLTPAFFPKCRDKGQLPYQLAFFGRMIFSCLVDADFRDTEAFYAEVKGEKPPRDWPAMPSIVEGLIARFDTHMEKKCASAEPTPVNALRNEILAHVRERATSARGLFTLTVPTGGGKTLTSLAFALEHAKRHGLERIVYAIPFTSIIDQTATTFKHILGEDVVLEHHSSIDEERLGAREAAEKLKLAMEDWAAPIVVTTNVQLFESLHSNRPSRCRRLHSLVNSVIILDEAQTIPLPVLLPCLAALDELAKNYGASIVLCTATQPAIAHSESFKQGLPITTERELAPDPKRLHHELKRVRLEWIGEKSDDELVSAIGETPQALVIVNSRAHALALYRKAREAGFDDALHLTTRQYAAHRRRILEEVRERLETGAPCRLIATSLVEAGVDLDFPRVWRAKAGLDQIAQAAGRCNREGKRPVKESMVFVFSTEHKPPREVAQLAADMGRIMDKHTDLLSPEAIEDYFGEVYWRKGEKLDKHEVLGAWRLSRSPRGPYMAPSFDYRRVAEDFRMIESGMLPVIVAIEKPAQEVLAALHGGLRPAAAARKLQPYIVQVPPKARQKLLENGHARFVEGCADQFLMLTTGSLYRHDIGLLWEDADYLGEEGIFI